MEPSFNKLQTLLMMHLKNNCLLVFSLFFAQLLTAQSISFSGRVLDALTEDPLIGVNVALRNSSVGTVTGEGGNFALSIPQDNVADSLTLVFSYVGYQNNVLTLPRNASSESFTVLLKEDPIRLNEVVVSGQGIDMEKRRLSTDVVTVTEEEIERVPAQRIDQILQSKLPNAQIRQANGQPGTASIVRSRGVVSAFVNSTPIVYVDGVRVDNLNTAPNLGLVLTGNRHQGAATSALADIPVENIERIEFINGGAATTLYGSDAANGVIQIITKKGGTGRTNVNVGVDFGATTPTNDFLFFDRTADLLFESGLHQKYNLGINGGNDQFGYSFSGSFLDDDGFRIHNQNENKRVDIRTGLTAQLADDFTYRSSFGYNRNNFSRVRNGNAGGYTGLWYTESGSSLFVGPGFNPNLDELSDEDFAAMTEFVSRAEELQNNDTRVNRFQTSQIFEYTPLQNLIFRATAGIDYRVQRETGIETNEYLNHVDDVEPENATFDRGSIQNFDRKFLGVTFELNGRYEATIGEFSFISTLGGQFFRNEDQQIEYTGIDVRDGAATIAQAATRQSNEFFSEVVNYGVYFQENVGFKNRYFLEFGVRGDGNSAFGDNIGVQYYPKVGGSYIVSAEPFFRDLFDNNTLSFLKLRGNYGVAGNFPRPFANERTIDFTGFQGSQAALFGQPGNEDLEPEKTYTYEVGAELGFFDNRVSMSANYYNAETRDALFPVPLAPSNGEAEEVLQNIGTIENKGWELAATFIPVQTKNWGVQLQASFNTLDNQVVDAGGVPPFNINGFSARTIQTVVEEGFPVGYLRGNLGVFENGLMVETIPQSFLGNTLPDNFGSMSLNVRFKDLTLYTSADYQTGAFAHSFERQFRFLYGANDEGIPQAEIDANGTGNWLNFTNRFVEETDFFKFRNMGVRYELPESLMGRFAKGISVGFNVINPVNFASSSFDPEATQTGGAQGQNSATTGGIAYASESAPRQFIGSVKFRF